MDLTWNLKSVSGCAAVRLLMRLCHLKIAELCNLCAAAPECGEYSLMVRAILQSQQVSSPVTNNTVKPGRLLVQRCLYRYADSMLSIAATAQEGVGNLQPYKEFAYIYCLYCWSSPHSLALTPGVNFFKIFITGSMVSDQHFVHFVPAFSRLQSCTHIQNFSYNIHKT